MLAAVLGAAPLAAQIMLRPDPLNAAWLSVPDATKTLMRSGFDYNDANYDSGNLIRVEPAGAAFTDPGSEWVLFDAAGPGVVTSIWFTGKSKAGAAYLGGRLNFYFDGERRPGISGALPDLLHRRRGVSEAACGAIERRMGELRARLFHALPENHA